MQLHWLLSLAFVGLSITTIHGSTFPREGGSTVGLFDRPNLFQQYLQLLGASSLEIRVATDVLLSNEDIGYGALAGDIVQGLLDSVAIVWKRSC
jgi:hypothetical protein